MAVKITVMPLDIDPSAKPVTQVFDKDELTLGRLPSNDIVLNRPEVSGIHARLRVEQNGSLETSKLFITDLGSSNGTMVEKNPLSPRQEESMKASERIFIGNFVIKPVFVPSESATETEHSSPSDAMEDVHPTQQMRRNVLEDAIGHESAMAETKSMASTDDAIDAFAQSRSMQEAPSDQGASPRNFLNSLIGEDAPSDPAFMQESASEEVAAPNFDRGFDRSSYGQESSSAREGYESVAPEASHEPEPTPAPSFKPEPTQVPSSTPSFSSPEPVQASSLSEDELAEELSITVKVDGSDVTSFDIAAAAYSDVVGAVLHKGRPLVGVDVVSPELGSTKTGPDGRFVFPRVLEGTSYSLQVRKAKFQFEPAGVNGTADLDAGAITVEAIELFTIKGVISHKGKPLEGVVVDGGPLGTYTTAADGVYVFENVPEGQEYDLKVSKDGYAFKR